MIIFFELLFLVIFIIALVIIVRKCNWPALAVVIVASITSMVGELINAYYYQVLVYNKSFWFWFPGRMIPIFAIVGSVILALLMYGLSNWILRKVPHRRLMAIPLIAFLSLVGPLNEQMGIYMSWWHWEKIPFSLQSRFWGVYLHYFSYFFSPAYVGWLVQEMQSSK